MRRLSFLPQLPPARVSPFGKSGGFTLVEMLVSMAVLTVILLGVTSVTNSATNATATSGQRLEADEQARIFLDRIQTDLTMMPRRADLDYQFIKATGNDRMFFFSAAPGYSGGMLGATFGKNVNQFMQQRSAVGLAGYMIDERDTYDFGQHQARRFGDANTWLNYGGSFKSMVTMAPSSLTSFTPAVTTTIYGSYSSFIGKNATDTPNWQTKSASTTTDKLWPLLAPSVFRLEFCYLLKDGTYSIRPIASKDQNGMLLNNYSGTADPTTSDTAKGAGARWWNEAAHRAFICTYVDSDPTNQTAVWKPYGMGDVAAIVVSIGVLDSRSRTILNSANQAARWTELMKLLPDPEVDAAGNLEKGSLASGGVQAGTTFSTQLPAQRWSQNLGDATSYQSKIVPQAVLSQVRVYQRTIYLR